MHCFQIGFIFRCNYSCKNGFCQINYSVLYLFVHANTAKKTIRLFQCTYNKNIVWSLQQIHLCVLIA